MSRLSPWLIAYDIRCPRRLGRIGRLVRRHGVRLQLSLYLVTESPVGIRSLRHQIASLMDEREDDLRIYPLREDLVPDFLGAPYPLLSQGLHLYGEGPAALLARWQALCTHPTAGLMDPQVGDPAQEDWIDPGLRHDSGVFLLGGSEDE